MSTMTSNTAAKTRTGGFPIGFRRGWSDWQKDLPALLAWAREENFSVIDLGQDALEAAPLAIKNGLRLGSVDFLEWRGMLSPDAAVRKDAVARNAAHIEKCAAAGITPANFFTVMIPEKPELPRAENFGYMVESFRQLAPTFEAHQAKLVIEGWPGDGVLCCTPEGYEAFFRECSSPCFGVNYDPSHLVRMGIDPLRFLHQFADRVFHVHGKDTELLAEELYRYGNYQAATFGKNRGFGALHWRYTIPGHGVTRWNEIFRILVAANYRGAVSVELEDENFNGSTETEKQGLIHARNFLASC